MANGETAALASSWKATTIQSWGMYSEVDERTPYR